MPTRANAAVRRLRQLGQMRVRSGWDAGRGDPLLKTEEYKSLHISQYELSLKKAKGFRTQAPSFGCNGMRKIDGVNRKAKLSLTGGNALLQLQISDTRNSHIIL